MSTLREHCEDCHRELGCAFEHVHLWLDELQQDYGPMHRQFRHNTAGVERVRTMWGDEAAKAAEIHIRKDCCGRILTPEEYRDCWGIDIQDIVPEEDNN